MNPIVSTCSGYRLVRLMTTVLLIGLVLGLTPVGAADLTKITAASDKAAARVSKALLEEDAGVLVSIFTEDGAIIAPSGQMIRGRLTIKTSASLLFMTMGGGKLKINRRNISIIDNNAYETGRYTFQQGDEDSPAKAFTGSYTIVWLKEQGEWKVDRLIGLK